MYRAVAWLAQRDGLDLTNGTAVAGLAMRAPLEVSDRVVVGGHDVTEAIRTPEIDRGAAIVARHPEVRAVLVARQREYGADGGLVMEGRDIGSVVFPEADVKIYLDASSEERARRRAHDPAHAAGRAPAAEVAEALAARDRADQTRAVSPLTRAVDAIYIDTTALGVDAVIEHVWAIVRERKKSREAR
jgi:cytidylate kinase